MGKIIFITANEDQCNKIEKWKETWKARGYEAEEVLLQGNLAEKVQYVVKSNADMVVGFNLECFDITMYGEDCYFNQLHCPFVTFLIEKLDEKKLGMLEQRYNINFVFISVCEEDVRKVKRNEQICIRYIEEIQDDWDEMEAQIEYAIKFGNDGDENV